MLTDSIPQELLKKYDGVPVNSVNKHVNLVICQEEHPDDFIGLLEEKLREPYLNTKIIAVYNSEGGELIKKIELLKKQDPRLAPLLFQANFDIRKKVELVNESLNGRDTYWVKGNGNLICNISYPKIFLIKKYEHVSDYLDIEINENKGPQELPEKLAITLTTKCNYTCIFCRHTNVGQTALPIEKFYALKKLIQKIKVLIITGWGEPLSYKYIKDVLKFINANNTNDCIRITTNGSLLTEEIAELLSKNLDSLLISLNAATKSTYERDMGNGRWDKVITNIKNAGKYIPRHKKTLTIVGHRDNIDEFPDFVKLAAELEFSTVLLYHLQVTLPENIDKSLWFIKEKTNELIDRAVELGIKNNVAVVAKKFSDLQPEQGVTACEFPFDTSIIEVNGDVLPCCFAEGHKMGNIHMFDEFENLWNNKKYNHLRKERYLEACQNCQFVSDYNKLQNHAPGFLFPEILKRLPKISIVIPCNGTSKWLPEAIKILLDQTYPVWEAIIVSGNSSEKEIKEIINCKDERIKIIEKTSKGFYSDLNEGIRHANGKYFCYMTSNSMFKLDKLEKQFKEMEKLDHHYALIYFSNVKENVDANSFKSKAVDLDSALFRMEAINGLEGFNVLSSNPPEDLLIRLKSKGYLSKSIKSEWNLNLARKFIDLGENYLLEGNEVKKAILAFKMAIEEDAYSAEAYNNLGVIYAYHRKYDEALKYLNKVLEIDPAHRKAIISVGEINRVLGKLDTTQYLYSKYLEQNSDDCEIKELLECLS